MSFWNEIINVTLKNVKLDAIRFFGYCYFFRTRIITEREEVSLNF